MLHYGTTCQYLTHSVCKALRRLACVVSAEVGSVFLPSHSHIHHDHQAPSVPPESFDRGPAGVAAPVLSVACFHYSNLLPLWPEDNLMKGSSH